MDGSRSGGEDAVRARIVNLQFAHRLGGASRLATVSKLVGILSPVNHSVWCKIDEDSRNLPAVNHSASSAFFFFFLTIVLSHWDFSYGKFGLLSPSESQLRQTRVTQPTVHAVCSSVSVTHRPLMKTTGSLTCAQM